MLAAISKLINKYIKLILLLIITKKANQKLLF